MAIEEIRTEPVSADRLRESVPEITDLLLSWGQNILDVTYGWECNLPIDRLWQPITVNAVDLQAFIERSEKEGVFQYGQCDLHIEDPQHVVEFLLCHESDMHFSSKDEQLIQQVLSAWRTKGFTLYVSPGPKGSAQPKDWKRLE